MCGGIGNTGEGIDTPAQLVLPLLPNALEGAIVSQWEALGYVADVGGQTFHDGYTRRGDGSGIDTHALVAVVRAAHLPFLTLDVRHTLTDIASTKKVSCCRAFEWLGVERGSMYC